MQRKTILRLKRILRECGVNWTDVDQLCVERKGWKHGLRERSIWISGIDSNDVGTGVMKGNIWLKRKRVE